MILLFFNLLLFTIAQIEAKPMKIEDFTFRVNNLSIQVNIFQSSENTICRSGNICHSAIYSYEVEWLKDVPSGHPIIIGSFNSDYEKIKVIEGYVKEPDGNTVKMDLDDLIIETQSNHMGLVGRKNILIPFKNLNKGFRIFYSFEKISFKNIIPEHFSLLIDNFGAGYFLNGNISITSSVPVFLEYNDPLNKLFITKDLSKKHSWTINLREPLFFGIINEKFSLLNPKNITQVGISTDRDFIKVGKNIFKKYEDILNKDDSLCAMLESQNNEIQKHDIVLKEPPDIFNAILKIASNLLEKLRYAGDWRNSDNLWFPHNLENIFQRGQGDCKDLAVAAVKSLRQAGLSSNIGFTNVYGLPTTLPLFFSSMFNHAMAVLGVDGSYKIIDLVTRVIHLDGEYYNLSNAKIYVLDKDLGFKKISLKRHANKNIYSIEEHMDLLSKNLDHNNPANIMIKKKGLLSAEGDVAQIFTGKLLSLSKENFTHQQLIPSIFSRNRTPLNFNFEEIDALYERNVKDIKLNFVLEENINILSLPNGEKCYLQQTELGFLNRLLRVDTKDRVGDFLLFKRTPYKEVRVYHSKVSAPQMKENFRLEFETKWVDFGRDFKVVYLPKEKTFLVSVKDYILYKDNLIIAEDIRSDNFLILLRKLKECFSPICIKI